MAVGCGSERLGIVPVFGPVRVALPGEIEGDDLVLIGRRGMTFRHAYQLSGKPATRTTTSPPGFPPMT
jgi:hypothetical protein